MPNYQLGKIYKIVDNTNNDVYIGSTTEPTLARRLSKHFEDYKIWKKGKRSYITSFKIFENQNYEIVLLESYPCSNKDELHMRERYYIENNTCINKYIPGRTKKEYYNDNYEHVREYRNEKFECPCGGKYTYEHKYGHYKTNKHKNYINNTQ